MCALVAVRRPPFPAPPQVQLLNTLLPCVRAAYWPSVCGRLAMLPMMLLPNGLLKEEPQ